MNLTKLDNKPVSDEALDALQGEDLMMAYLVAQVTPEQKARIAGKLVTLFPKRAA